MSYAYCAWYSAKFHFHTKKERKVASQGEGSVTEAQNDESTQAESPEKESRGRHFRLYMQCPSKVHLARLRYGRFGVVAAVISD